MSRRQIEKYSWALEVKYNKVTFDAQYLASAYFRGERQGLIYEIDERNAARFGLLKELKNQLCTSIE